MSNLASAPPAAPLPRRRFAAPRLALALVLAALPLATGCAAGSREAMAPGAPMADMAVATPPMAAQAPAPEMAPASPAPVSAGYPAPAAPPGYGGDEATVAAAPAAKAAPPATAKINPPVSRAPARAPTPTPAKGPEKAEKPASAEQAPASPARPMLIYVGNLRLQVEGDAAIPTTLDKIIDIAEALGGYLVGRKDTSVEVRIPSMRFRDGFTQIEKLAEVLGRSVSADDVSEQYHDLEVRLSNLRATQKRLQDFLAKAGTMADMLTVGRELERVSGEIDQIEGKMRFLRSRAAFSLVTVNVQAKPKAVVIAEPTRLPPPPPHEITLPVTWLPRVGIGELLDLN